MNKQHSILKHFDFFILDVICLFVCFVASYYYKMSNINFYNSELYTRMFIIMILINICVDFIYSPYKNVLKRGYFKELIVTYINSLLQLLVFSLILVLNKEAQIFSRQILLTTYFSYALITYFVRLLWKKYIIVKSKYAIEKGNKSLLVVTDLLNVEDLILKIKNNNFNMYKIAGLCVIDGNLVGQTVNDIKVVANKDNILEYICKNWIDEVYFSLQYDEIPKEILKGLSIAGITIHVKLSDFEQFEGRSQSVGKLFNDSVMTSEIRPRTNLEIFIKRLMDIVGGLIGSLITLILTIFIGPIIYIKSPGPIFFKQERIGLNGKHFYMYKFRSMIPNADLKKEELKKDNIMSGSLFKIENDPRIIPGIGNFIRKTSLDEFPQFFNVLLNDMSLVGTRPPTIDEWVEYKLEQRIRMSVKPGITGIWQTSGRNKVTDFNKVVEMDREYMNKWSIGLDIKILFKTIYVLLFDSRGAM